jgi:type IV pilus assembly protein PilP
MIKFTGYKIKSTRLLGLLAPVLLAACSNSNDEMVDLQNRVNGMINRPPGQIEPLPEFVSYEAFNYSAASLRAPFDAPLVVTGNEPAVNNQDVRPDENRPKEELEAFSIGTLKMVGTMSRNNAIWVLVRDENRKLHRVTVGNYLGKNHGRIISASKTQIDIVEIVPSGDGGWIERPQTITLQD